MLLRKNDYPTVDPEDPWSVDRLDRKKVAEFLTPILASISQPFVIALESPYGTGKSLFIECWKHHLNQEKIFKAVRFNAWETDFSHDPLSAFISFLKKEFPEKRSHAAKASMLSSGKKIMKATALRLPGIVIKSAIRKAVGVDGADEIFDALSVNAEDLESLSDQIVEEAIKTQEDAEESITAFRHSLEAMIKSLSEERGESTKLIVFVDELDRCKPTYAISLLECIKHLFSVPGVVFILAIDRSSLRSAVKTAYASVDEDAYLSKFIDWQYRLPPPDARKYAIFLAEKFALADVLGVVKSINRDTLNEAVEVFGKACAGLGLSLREQERIFCEFNLAMRSVGQDTAAFAIETAVLSVLRRVREAQIDRLLVQGTNPFDLARELADSFVKDPIFGDTARDRAIFQSWFMTDQHIQYALGQAQPADRIDQMREAGEIAKNMRAKYRMSRTTIGEFVLQRLAHL